jgi:hypothetical protein
MEAVFSSATSVNYPTVRRHNSEDTTRPCQKFELRVTQRSVCLGAPYHPLYHWASRPTKCLPGCAISPTSPLSESPSKVSDWVRHIAHFTVERVSQQSVGLGAPYRPLHHWASLPTKCLCAPYRPLHHWASYLEWSTSDSCSDGTEFRSSPDDPSSWLRFLVTRTIIISYFLDKPRPLPSTSFPIHCSRRLCSDIAGAVSTVPVKMGRHFASYIITVVSGILLFLFSDQKLGVTPI